MGTKCAGVKRLWRPFLGVVVAYAIAIQSLLIVLGGFAPAAQMIPPSLILNSVTRMLKPQSKYRRRIRTRGALTASSASPERIMR